MPNNVNEVKLKDYLEKSIDEANKDLVANITNPNVREVIIKYHQMLINIKSICQNRNKF